MLSIFGKNHNSAVRRISTLQVSHYHNMLPVLRDANSEAQSQYLDAPACISTTPEALLRLAVHQSQ